MGKKPMKKKNSIGELLPNEGRHSEAVKPPHELPTAGSLQRITSKATLLLMLSILVVSFAVYYNALKLAN